MANRNELLKTFLNKLFNLSSVKYSKIFEEFKIKTLDEIQHFSNEKLEKIIKKIDSLLKMGTKKMGKHYTGKDFDKEVEGLFFKSAVKLAQDKEEEKKEAPKEEAPKEEAPKEEEEKPIPQEESGEESEGEEEEVQKIEDVVKDQQIALLDKFNEIKTFKPGRSEAINFRNSLTKLIEEAEASVNAINEYYDRELGKGKEKEKTSASKKITAKYDTEYEDSFTRCVKGEIKSF
jgi:hypothetical protein